MRNRRAIITRVGGVRINARPLITFSRLKRAPRQRKRTNERRLLYDAIRIDAEIAAANHHRVVVTGARVVAPTCQFVDSHVNSDDCFLSRYVKGFYR